MTRKRNDKTMEFGMPLWFHAALKEVAASQYRAMNIVLRLTFEETYPEIVDKHKRRLLPEYAEEKKKEQKRELEEIAQREDLSEKEQRRIERERRAEEVNEMARKEQEEERIANEMDDDEFDFDEE